MGYYTIFVKVREKNGKIEGYHNHYEDDAFRGIGRKEILAKATKHMVSHNKRKGATKKYLINSIRIKKDMVHKGDPGFDLIG